MCFVVDILGIWESNLFINIIAIIVCLHKAIVFENIILLTGKFLKWQPDQHIDVAVLGAKYHFIVTFSFPNKFPFLHSAIIGKRLNCVVIKN